MDLISVIVPVYKVEKYLDRCVQSIVDQTYTNLEIILVDDGSPDNCPAMCDAWAAKDSRIRVIHKENGGLSDARNAGIQMAAGEYIGFVDSDDHIAPEMYQLLYDQMQIDGSDIAACGVEMFFEDGTPSRRLTCEGKCTLNRREAMEAVIRESWLKQPVWYKLYRAAVVRDIPFPVGKYHEDVFWTYQAVARANAVSVFDTPCYFYLQRGESIMGESYSLKRLDAIEGMQQRLEYLRDSMPELVNVAVVGLCFSCLYQGQKAIAFLCGSDRTDALVRLRKTVKDCPVPSRSYLRSIRFTRRVWLWLARSNFSLCCRIRNRLKIGL